MAMMRRELRLVVGDGGSGEDGAAEGEDDAERSGRHAQSERLVVDCGRLNGDDSD